MLAFYRNKKKKRLTSANKKYLEILTLTNEIMCIFTLWECEGCYYFQKVRHLITGRLRKSPTNKSYTCENTQADPKYDF